MLPKHHTPHERDFYVAEFGRAGHVPRAWDAPTSPGGPSAARARGVRPRNDAAAVPASGGSVVRAAQPRPPQPASPTGRTAMGAGRDRAGVRKRKSVARSGGLGAVLHAPVPLATRRVSAPSIGRRSLPWRTPRCVLRRLCSAPIAPSPPVLSQEECFRGPGGPPGPGFPRGYDAGQRRGSAAATTTASHCGVDHNY